MGGGIVPGIKPIHLVEHRSPGNGRQLALQLGGMMRQKKKNGLIQTIWEASGTPGSLHCNLQPGRVFFGEIGESGSWPRSPKDSRRQAWGSGLKRGWSIRRRSSH